MFVAAAMTAAARLRRRPLGGRAPGAGRDGSPLVAGWRWWRGWGADPAGIAGGPLAVGAEPLQDGVDEPGEVGVPLGDGQAVRFVAEARADDLGRRVLCGEPGQDRVVSGDRGDVALLEQHQAVDRVW